MILTLYHIWFLEAVKIIFSISLLISEFCLFEVVHDCSDSWFGLQKQCKKKQKNMSVRKMSILVCSCAPLKK